MRPITLASAKQLMLADFCQPVRRWLAPWSLVPSPGRRGQTRKPDLALIPARAVRSHCAAERHQPATAPSH